MCLKILVYSTSTYVYQTAEDVQWSKWLNGYSVHNIGNTNLIINGDTIPPDGSKTVGGNYGEIHQGNIAVQFRVPTPAPMNPMNMVVVTQKFYTNLDKL